MTCRRPSPALETVFEYLMRFYASHLGSGLWGLYDGGVMTWLATDLSENEAKEQAGGPERHLRPVGPATGKRAPAIEPADPGGVSNMDGGG
jgi:hypothetical protein